jgi:hypothetical protein
MKVLGPMNPPALVQDIELESNAPPAQPPLAQTGSSRARSASVLSDPSDGEVAEASGLADVDEIDAENLNNVESVSPEDDVNDEELEDWEIELKESVQGLTSHVHNWSDLWKEIKDHLNTNSSTLLLSQINQLLIISNFATLQIKGVSRTQASFEIARQWHEGQGNWFARRVQALARHYQIFEALPIEKRGGARKSKSWLYDEQVKTRTQDWLTSQETGDVTPRQLRHAVNEIILPELKIFQRESVSNCSSLADQVWVASNCCQERSLYGWP